jgi:hypothetical protein
MSKIDLHEVVDFIGTLSPDDGSVVERVAEKYPLSRDEFLHLASLLRAREEELKRERVALERISRIASRYGFGPSNPKMKLGEALRRAAEAGDEEAAAAVASLNSPETNAWNAVFVAAAERHPDWRPVPDKAGEYYGPKAKEHSERDPERLVAWFERTYPAEAALITAEALVN